MSLSEQFIKLIDVELDSLRITIMAGNLSHDSYKFCTGKHIGLSLAKELLKETLDSAKKDDD